MACSDGFHEQGWWMGGCTCRGRICTREHKRTSTLSSHHFSLKHFSRPTSRVTSHYLTRVGQHWLNKKLHHHHLFASTRDRLVSGKVNCAADHRWSVEAHRRHRRRAKESRGHPPIGSRGILPHRVIAEESSEFGEVKHRPIRFSTEVRNPICTPW